VTALLRQIALAIEHEIARDLVVATARRPCLDVLPLGRAGAEIAALRAALSKALRPKNGAIDERRGETVAAATEAQDVDRVVECHP
jgi:hypothetical protein